ncbi:hypothetical protein OAJ94_03435, partial [Deltaproteobacteria bacterium]|nr:hypothetical protein [Deltaproteobacteria bacterium]
DPDANGVWNQWQDLPTTTSNDVAFQRWEMAMAWLLTIPGAPLIYAGDEHAMVGGADPDNRRMFDDSARDSDWVQYFAKARAELEPLRRGEYVQLTAEEEIMAFARQSEEEHVVVVLNRGGNSINLSSHQWLGNMSNYLGEVEWNGGDIEMDGVSAAIFTLSSENITIPEENNTIPEENNTIPEENNTNPEDNTTLPVDNNTGNETSVEAESKSSGLMAESAKWVLIGLIGIVVGALIFTSRRRE